MISIFGKTPQTLGLVHFSGIGGVGMSALAELLHECGFHVQGSDVQENVNVKRLKEKGVRIFSTHAAAHVEKAFRVVYSSAIQEDNPELLSAKELGVRTMHRGELLAEVAKQFTSIAITGTHGKTTTTAMVYTILAAAGKDVGVVNGGILYALKSNMKLPSSKNGLLVLEADESDGSFTYLMPDYSVITNIEPEHMEYYGSMENVLKNYNLFASSAKQKAVLNVADENAQILAKSLVEKKLEISFSGESSAAENIIQRGAGVQFTLNLAGERIENVMVPMPGVHNVQNAVLAAAVCKELGLTLAEIKQGLASFKGVGRRFIKIGEVNGAAVVDDYAHHPSEVKATIEAVKHGFSGRVLAVFQPHRYTRLRDQFDEFITAFSGADEVYIAPVYAAGEEEIPNINSERLVRALKKKYGKKDISLAGEHNALAFMLEESVKEGDIVLFMGAGNINQWAVYFLKKAKGL